MHKNYFTLRALAAQFLRTLAGRKFFEAYSHQPGELILCFIGDDDLVDIRVITGVQEGCVFMVPHANPPKRNVMRFFGDVAGALVKNVTVASSDRTIIIDLGDHGSLHIRMFGAGGGNVVRADITGTPVESFKKERTADLRGNAMARPWEEVLTDDKTFALALARTASALGTALNKAIPPLGKPLVEEALHRAGVQAIVSPGDIGAAAMAKLYQAVTAIIDECMNAPSPRVYVDGQARFALIPLQTHEKHTQLPCRDISDGIRRWTAEHGKADGAQAERQRIARVLKAYREYLANAIEKVTLDLASHKEDMWQKMGELLMANIATLPVGVDGVTIDGVEIALDKTISPGQNAAAYFEKAKHRKTALVQTARRLENLIERQAIAAARDEEFKDVHTRDELEKFVLANHDLLKQMEQQSPNAPRPHPYRSYRLSEECEVFVGRNAKQNDELTFHFAKQNDLWFHVRGYEGSHAILRYDRRENPPKEFIIKAAAIAAYHSKAKGSKLVPVIYTQRKFVHKPRGAKPGSVVCQREDVVMVAPYEPPPTL